MTDVKAMPPDELIAALAALGPDDGSHFWLNQAIKLNAEICDLFNLASPNAGFLRSVDAALSLIGRDRVYSLCKFGNGNYEFGFFDGHHYLGRHKSLVVAICIAAILTKKIDKGEKH